MFMKEKAKVPDSIQLRLTGCGMEGRRFFFLFFIGSSDELFVNWTSSAIYMILCDVKCTKSALGWLSVIFEIHN